MLVTFALGMASLAWMFGFAAVMAAEKTTRWGAAMARPVGAMLVVGGAAWMLL
jgi:predicted metal-binding membrane protein